MLGGGDSADRIYRGDGEVQETWSSIRARVPVPEGSDQMDLLPSVLLLHPLPYLVHPGGSGWPDRICGRASRLHFVPDFSAGGIQVHPNSWAEHLEKVAGVH